jgi:hypothetical protein
MKRPAITFYLFLCSIFTFGQSHFLGISGGTSWTKITSNFDVSDFNFRNSISGGIVYEYQFKNNFQIGADLLYAQRGFKNKIQFTDEFGNPYIPITTIEQHYNYVSLPIKCGLRIGKRFSGFFNIGVVPSLLLKAEVTTSAIGNTPAQNNDISELVKKTDLAGLTEIGANFAINKEVLVFASFVYQNSLTTYYNNSINSKNRQWGMTLSIGAKRTFLDK